jgi:DNA-directed RNA polymerase specialized sigma subunit
LDNKKTIELLRHYRENGCEDAFSEVYNAYKHIITLIVKEKTESNSFPKEEMLSGLRYQFWKMASKFDETKSDNFGAFIKSTLNKRAVSILTRKHGTYYSRVKSVIDEDKEDDDGNSITFEIPSELTVEDEISIKTKKADQRQLIDSLTDPAKVDATTTEIVEAFSQYKSITALGKALGLNHNTVKRKLNRLSRNFDESVFGDYRDYLAV